MVELGLYDGKTTYIYRRRIESNISTVDLSRDMVYDYAGANMLVNRYLIKHDGKTYELPQENIYDYIYDVWH